MTRAPDAFCRVIPIRGNPVDADIVSERPKKCRIPGSCGAGHDLIGVHAARDAGVVVSNSAGSIAGAIASAVVPLMPTTARRPVADRVN